MSKDNNTVVFNIEVKGCCSEEEIAAVVKRELDKMTANTKPKFLKREELGEISGFYVDDNSKLYYCSAPSDNPECKNIWPTKELAEAQLAMSQLAHLRDYVNDGWKPDWTAVNWKYVIKVYAGLISTDYYIDTQFFLAFKNAETRDGFLEAYRDLIEIAKPLL